MYLIKNNDGVKMTLHLPDKLVCDSRAGAKARERDSAHALVRVIPRARFSCLTTLDILGRFSQEQEHVTYLCIRSYN